MNQKLDTFGYKSENNVNARNVLLEGMENLGLIDIFREFFPEKKRFSWRKFGDNKKARLDFHLISIQLLPFVKKCDILPGIFSDHSIVELEIDFSKFIRGRGFFKYNNSLNSDLDYVKKITETIRRVSKQYAECVYDPNFFLTATPEQLQDLTLTINPQLFLETLLFEIRGTTIEYCATKKKKRNAILNLALHRLEAAESESDSQPCNEHLLKELNAAKQEVEAFAKIESEGALTRARIRWQLEGEKPSRYFCNLEKYNALQKYIPQLKVKNAKNQDIIVKDQQKIDLEIQKFYANLYKSQEPKNIGTIDDFLGAKNVAKCPKISETEALQVEGLVCIEEATQYMKKCRADASPGSSGFTGGFYKCFWRNLKHSLIKSFNHGYENGNLSITQKLGVIILLPKPNKDKTLLSNWRPISLLNHSYKILSGVLAERLKPTLPSVIHQDQKGFVKGRYIGECIRTTFDIIEYCKANNKVGLLLLIDFEKAFDSVSHSFIIKTLKFFGYGYSFIKWINLILHDLSSCINHCGNVTERFKVGRSCRQGDPISPYLFILCAEILALKIRQNQGVKGFRIGNWQHKVDMYADDLTCYLDGSEESLRQTINILDEFETISGLKINLGKCKAVWIGKNRFSKVQLCSDLKLIWSDSFTLLGIDFDSDLAKMDTNFRDRLEYIEKLYNNWLYRKLTPLGKITVIKTMALSQLSHVVLVCPHLGQDRANLLNKLSYQFLWSNKPDRVKRTEAVLPVKYGGLNMPDIKTFWESLKCTWARRLMSYGTAWHKVLQANLLSCGLDFNEFLFSGPNELNKCALKLTNYFWKEVINIFALLSSCILKHRPHYFFHQNLFDNEYIKYGKTLVRKFDFPILWSKNIRQVGDLFDCNATPPRLLNRLELNSKYSINLDFLRFHNVSYSVQTAAANLGGGYFDLHTSDVGLPRLPLLFKISLEQNKGCRFYYQTLRTNIAKTPPKGEQKWQEKLETIFSINFWDNIYKLAQNPLLHNKLVWTQIQINKYLLPTNYSVNFYDKNVQPNCSYCMQNPEKLHHLIWTCEIVQEFWKMIRNLIQNFYPTFLLSKKEAIFGDVKTEKNSPINTILMLARYYIYQQKFLSKELDEVRFINYVRDHLSIIFMLKNKQNELFAFLKEWFDIFNHFQIPD